MREIQFIRPIVSPALNNELTEIKSAFNIEQEIPSPAAIPIVSRYMFNKKLLCGVADQEKFTEIFLDTAESLVSEDRKVLLGKLAIVGNEYTPRALGYKVDKATAQDAIRDRLLLAHEVGFRLMREEKETSDIFVPIFSTSMKHPKRVPPKRAQEIIAEINKARGNLLIECSAAAKEVIAQ